MTLLPTDLVFLENKQKWLPISELPQIPKDDAEEVALFKEKLRAVTPKAFVTPALIALNVAIFVMMAVAGVSLIQPTNLALIQWGADFGAADDTRTVVAAAHRCGLFMQD